LEKTLDQILIIVTCDKRLIILAGTQLMLCILEGMKKILFLLFVAVACSPKSGFNAFFDDEAAIADQAIDLPKWLPMLAIPEEAKDDIKLFTKGMKRVKLLRYEKRREEGKERFLQFKKMTGMDEYLSLKSNDVNMNVVSKEQNGEYNEILIAFDANSEYYILGLTGKMKKQDFQAAVVEANKQREKNNSND